MNSLRTRVSVLDRQRRHRSTARAIWRLLPEPESWLDVGTGDAHFPETARQLFPYTSIDGLDPTPRVAYARHAERVEEAYAGHVTDPHITTILRARYDIVTLLERRSPAPDPAAEPQRRPHPAAPRRPAPCGGGPPEAHGLRAQLESQGCTIVATSRHVLDRLPYTCRIIARRTASAA